MVVDFCRRPGVRFCGRGGVNVVVVLVLIFVVVDAVFCGRRGWRRIRSS